MCGPTPQSTKSRCESVCLPCRLRTPVTGQSLTPRWACPSARGARSNPCIRSGSRWSACPSGCYVCRVLEAVFECGGQLFYRVVAIGDPHMPVLTRVAGRYRTVCVVDELRPPRQSCTQNDALRWRVFRASGRSPEGLTMRKRQPLTCSSSHHWTARRSVRMEQGGASPCRSWSKPPGNNPRRWARPGRDKIEPLVPFLCSTLHDCSSKESNGGHIMHIGKSAGAVRAQPLFGLVDQSFRGLPSRLSASPPWILAGLRIRQRRTTVWAWDVRCCGRHRSTIDRRTAAQGFLPAPGIRE
jgi:hypothetical protein